MAEYSIEDAGKLARVVSGDVDPTKLTLFSTMKNEMGFLPAFLAHYRSIGFEQFLIFDDASDDGTFEFLSGQPDCIVMHSERGFGDEIYYRDPDGNRRKERVGTYFKIALPHLFFDGAYVGYADADEFLVLPPGVASISDVVERLKDEGAPSVVSSVVEFFPAGIEGLRGDLPQSFETLLAAYPYFQPEKLVALKSGTQPDLVGKAKTTRLFEVFDIEPKVVRQGLQRIYMSSRAKKAQRFQKSARHKTPIVLRNADSRMTGSHAGNLPPSNTMLLTMVHFVFTSQFSQKIRNAIEWGAHANAAAKYRYYAELLEKIQKSDHGFLDSDSVRFERPEQFIECDLMMWPQNS